MFSIRNFITVISFILILAFSIQAGPRISVSEASFNFGKTAQHADVSHTFWIKSTGDDTLLITKIVPGCGCTKAPLTDSSLAPGDSAALELIFSTKSYRGFVSKKPYIETNISEEKIYLRIDTELKPKPDSEYYPIRITPFKVDVSQFSETVRRKAKFTIENLSNETLELKLIGMNNKKFDLDFPTKLKPGEIAEGMVDVHESEVENEFSQSITFELNDADNSRYTIPVRRVVRKMNIKN